MATWLTFTMTEELYGRLTDRLRHVMQFSEASRHAAEEALDLLEAAKKTGSAASEGEILTSDKPRPHAGTLDQQLGEVSGGREVTGGREATRDVDAAFYLLAVHRLVEEQANGSARYLAQAEAMAIMAALNRLAPSVLDEALAVHEREDRPIGVVLEALSRGGAR